MRSKAIHKSFLLGLKGEYRSKQSGKFTIIPIKILIFFILTPPKIFLSTLAIKQLLRPKHPSLISPPTLPFTHLSQTDPTPIIGGDINPRRRRLHLSPASDLQPSTKPRYMAKSESPDIEVGKMYFSYADHFPGRISSMCKLSSVIKAIEEKLTKRQLTMFKNDIFGHFLECRSFPFSGVILHNLLLRQVAHEEDSREDQLWFQIGEHLIRLSIVEWCLVTGLSFGVDTNQKNDEMEQRLRNTYFGGVHRKINVKEFDAIFKELKFEEMDDMDDMDALKIALFYFADRVLNARKNHCQINFDWLDQVDDIQYFRKRSWDLLSWEMIYESFDNALFEKDEKFKKTRLKNPDHNIEKYNLYGFTSGVQAWIYEAIGGLPSIWVVKTKNKIPRILQLKPMASSRINFAEVYSFFNDESRLGDVLQTLKPNSKESSRKYWLSVKDYLPSIPG
ncbi:uncharacterized protein LOC112498263 [Citrus sinensis]|uniref:uncharacterized protein LOC112498263 n=1 Tax=Citrus sinensis TaxID=2711 RepID=UPI002278CC57|nr:uncharacterized protein LOC112498263 [Citrus sinensis]